MESRCHLGTSIVYDTVSNLSWSVDVRTHGIVTVIEKLLSDPWAPSDEMGREVPFESSEDDCVVCYISLFYTSYSSLVFLGMLQLGIWRLSKAMTFTD